MRHYSINESRWQDYLEFISRMTLGQHVELAISGLDIGSQIETEWTQLDGLSYDPESQTLFVHTAPVEHLIAAPVEIVALEDDTAIRALSVKDGEGRVQTITFRQPLMLSAHEDDRH